MAVRYVLAIALLSFVACKHIGLLFEPPSTLKAVIQGEIKGMSIHCEKTLRLGNTKWEVMCKVSDEIDIKYRTQSIDSLQTRLEIVVDRQNGQGEKAIMIPIVVAANGKPALIEAVTERSRIAVKTESVR